MLLFMLFRTQNAKQGDLLFDIERYVLESDRITAHGRLFETCAYLFKMPLGWALIRDVRLFETCAKSSIYGTSILLCKNLSMIEFEIIFQSV